MTRIFGWIVAGGLILGAAGSASAQFAVSIGNPYYGRGVYVGAPAYIAPAPVVAAPVVAAPVVGVGIYGYPAYQPYGYYGRGYGYGPRPWGPGPYRRW